MPKRPPGNAKAAKRRAAEYRFKIEAFDPDTMPMERLAEYVKELSIVLGDPASVHLVGIEAGSTVPVVRVAYEAIPKVQDRVDSVRRGDAPLERQQAFKRINKMLREDNGKADLRRGKHGARLLVFPGKDEAEDAYAHIRQSGAIEGTLIRVGGSGDTIPIWLESEGATSHCYGNRQLAKELAKYMFEPIRIHGLGVWERDKEGEWKLTSFQVQSYEILDPASLSTVVAKLRSVKADLGDDPVGDVLRIRHGADH